MEEVIGDITLDALEQIIPEAKWGSKEALRSLMGHRWTIELLDKVSSSVGRKFRIQDRGEIISDLFIKVYKNIAKVNEPEEGMTWCDNLEDYLYAIARNEFLSGKRHERVVNKHRDRCASESVDFKRKG